MRKFAWAKFFEASGIKKGTAAEKTAAAANESLLKSEHSLPLVGGRSSFVAEVRAAA
ncbi:MAG: hypothetical protein WCU80_08555 [Paludibacteraceae bacterium]|nr:hypothetical protein [Prevotellaceae bacterium]